MADVDNDELAEEIPDVLVDHGKNHIGDFEEDEISPERYAEMKAERKLTTKLPELSKMYDILSHLREGYHMLRTMCINEKHTEYMDILDLLDMVIQDWVVECNEVEGKTKVKASTN